MPMQIYIAHSGACLQADPHDFASVDELRKWIERNISMPPSCQILMTALGRNIKAQTLSNEREIYLFDRRLLTTTSSPSPSAPIPRVQTPSPFPDSLTSETDLSSWRTLFKKRLLWSESVLTHAQTLASTITETDTASSTMQRAVLVAFSNLETHTTGLQNSLGKLREWADGVLGEQDKVLREWEPSVGRLARIAVHEELRKYGLAGGEEGQQREVKVLSDFFDVKAVQIAAGDAAASAQKFERDVVELGGTIEDVVGRTTDLKNEIQKSQNSRAGDVPETLKMLIAEIDVVVRKVRTDYEYVLSLQGPKAISTASKRAYASTTEYLPGLVNTVTDVGRLLQQVVQQKNTITAICTRHLQTVAHIQQISAPINPQISALDTAYQDEDASFRLLSLVTGFPSIYGSLLIECVRRREWSEKFSNDSKRVAEELALLKEEEEKRRKKWQRNVGEFLPFSLDDGAEVVRAELNTRGDFSGGLPRITRADVDAFIACIKPIEGMEPVVKEINALAAKLDEPLRRHTTRRMKGFKFGSVHEAGLGASSIFSTGNDEVRALRADKEQLTERVKGYESRIRKLEDLIHRARQQQGAYQGLSSPIPQTPGTPLPGASFPSGLGGGMGLEPPSSPIAIRRISTEPNERPMPARVVALEAELALERELTAKLQREAATRGEAERDLATRMEQADDTKRDLVANLEALDQQHVVERKEFQREIDELRGKIEEAYEEMDRLEEMRAEEENRRRSVEDRRGALERELGVMSAEVERLRGREEELEEEVGKVQGEVKEEREMREKVEEELKAEKDASEGLRETIRGLEEKMKGMKEVLDGAKTQNASQAEKEFSLATTMRSAHEKLSTDSPSEDLNTLMASIDTLISSTVSNAAELNAQLQGAKLRADKLEEAKNKLQSRFESRSMKAKDLTQRLYTCNVRSIQLLEALGYRVVRGEGEGVMNIVKVSRRESNSGGNMGESMLLGKSTNDLSASKTMFASKTLSPSKSGHLLAAPPMQSAEDIKVIYWMSDTDSEAESSAYSLYLSTTTLDLDAFTETILTRLKKADSDARTLMKQCRLYREKYYRARDEANEKIAFKSFKSGDLALFLPTRNSVTRPWAAFNVGAPHFFLKEEVGHKLGSRDWLLARIGRVEERVVDLSRSTAQLPAERASLNSIDDASIDDENPFELSDGLRWYLLDAVEEKPGAPSTPGLSSSTVAAANVDAKGSLRSRKPVTGAKKTLSQITTEHSRRSSSASGRGTMSRDGVPGEVVAAVREAIEGRGGEAAVAVEGDKERPGTSRPSTGITPMTPITGRPATGTGLGVDGS